MEGCRADDAGVLAAVTTGSCRCRQTSRRPWSVPTGRAEAPSVVEETDMLETNPRILDEARRIVESGVETLPCQLPGFRHIFVAAADDPDIRTLAGLVHDGTSYKIGTKA